jgi:hypothetical protein
VAANNAAHLIWTSVPVLTVNPIASTPSIKVCWFHIRKKNSRPDEGIKPFRFLVEIPLRVKLVEHLVIKSNAVVGQDFFSSTQSCNTFFYSSSGVVAVIVVTLHSKVRVVCVEQVEAVDGADTIK